MYIFNTTGQNVGIIKSDKIGEIAKTSKQNNSFFHHTNSLFKGLQNYLLRLFSFHSKIVSGKRGT